MKTRTRKPFFGTFSLALLLSSLLLTRYAKGKEGNHTEELVRDIYQHYTEESYLKSVTEYVKARVDDTNSPVKNVVGSSSPSSCTFQLEFSMENYNVFIPDIKDHILAIPLFDIKSQSVYRLSGKFPRARYFSYTVYEYNGLWSEVPASAVPDYKLSPKTGKNPFLASKYSNADGTYEIYFTIEGNEGYQNELRVTKWELDQGDTISAVVLLRVLDPVNENILKAKSGAPKMEISRNNGFDFEEINLCVDNIDEKEREIMYKKIIKHGHKNTHGIIYEDQNLSGDFFTAHEYYYDYNSNDAFSYMSSVGPENSDKHVFAVVSGIVPRSHEIRYSSWLVGSNKFDYFPTISGFSDFEINAYYANMIPKWNRNFFMVVGADKVAAESCGIYNNNSDIFVQIGEEFQSYRWTIVYKQLLSNYQVSETPDQSIAYALSSCSGIVSTDVNESRIRSCIQSFMGEKYPNVTYYTCQDGASARVHASS